MGNNEKTDEWVFYVKETGLTYYEALEVLYLDRTTKKPILGKTSKQGMPDFQPVPVPVSGRFASLRRRFSKPDNNPASEDIDTIIITKYQDLPDGWKVVTNLPDGRTLYHNEKTGQTGFEFPEEAPKPGEVGPQGPTTVATSQTKSQDVA